MPSELVWVALIAALGPIVGFFAKPVADAISGWLQAGHRRREQEAAAAREAQDAMAYAMQRRSAAEFSKDVDAAKALALAILALAERIADRTAREAVKSFVELASGSGSQEETRAAYAAANAALGAIVRG